MTAAARNPLVLRGSAFGLAPQDEGKNDSPSPHPEAPAQRATKDEGESRPPPPSGFSCSAGPPRRPASSRAGRRWSSSSGSSPPSVCGFRGSSVSGPWPSGYPSQGAERPGGHPTPARPRRLAMVQGAAASGVGRRDGKAKGFRETGWGGGRGCYKLSSLPQCVIKSEMVDSPYFSLREFIKIGSTPFT